METISVVLLLLAIVILIILSDLFPGINIFTIFDPKKKYFYNASINNNQLLLKGFRKEVVINANEIKRLSMGPFGLRAISPDKGIFAVQIDTFNDTIYVFQSPFNLIAPAFRRDLIKQLRTLNPNIDLDYNLKKYTEESLADMYINREQIKRGLLVILIFTVLVILVYFKQLLK